MYLDDIPTKTMILGAKFKIGKKASFSRIPSICLTSEVQQAV